MLKKLLIGVLGLLAFTPLTLDAESLDDRIADLNYYSLNQVYKHVERPLLSYRVAGEVLEIPFKTLNNMTLPEVFGDIETTVDDYRLAKSLDEPIAELNNHTLREVFEGGQLLTNSNIDNNTNWGSYASSSVTFDSGLAIIYRENTNAGLLYTQNISVSNGDKIYIISNERKTLNHTTTGQAQIGLLLYSNANTVLTSQLSNINITNQFNNYTTLLTLSNINVVSVRPLIYQSSSSGITEIEVDSVKLYNLSALGLSSLTVAQMDYWFSVYVYVYFKNGTPIVRNEVIDNYLYVNNEVVFNIDTFIDLKTYSPLSDTTFDLMTLQQQTAQLDAWALDLDTKVANLQLALDKGLTLDSTELLYWYDVYNNPNYTSLFTLGTETFYKNNGDIFDINQMKLDRVYNKVNDTTIEKLTDNIIISEFETGGLSNKQVIVLSYTKFLDYVPLGTESLMLQYYEDYLRLNDYGGAYDNLSNNDLVILLTTLIVFIIGIFMSWFLKNNIILLATSLLWFVPVLVFNNVFIIVFSIVMFIMTIVIVFFSEKEEYFT